MVMLKTAQNPLIQTFEEWTLTSDLVRIPMHTVTCQDTVRSDAKSIKCLRQTSFERMTEWTGT